MKKICPLITDNAVWDTLLIEKAFGKLLVGGAGRSTACVSIKVQKMNCPPL